MMLTVVVEQFAQASLASAVDPISEVEQELVYEVEPEPFFLLVLTVNGCIKVRLDLQADKSPIVVKGPFFPRVVNPRYRIRGTNV
jgi:hypothetical protein